MSDTALRFALLSGNKWITASLRLPPGIVEKGEIKNKEQFLAALKELHNQIVGPRKARKKIGVVVSLSSVDIYSQTFSLPVIEGENLERAVQLNIQMTSPIAVSETYSGWQILGEDKTSVRLEILSAFIKRELVDEMISALRAANFVPHSLESRGLSLTRVIRQLSEGFDSARSYLVLDIDDTGLEFLVIRRAQLYFQYFIPWSDIYGEERQISQEAFEAAIVRSLHQVINFYHSHWPDPLNDIYLVVPSLREEVIRIINANFSLNILEVRLNGMLATPEWFMALGAAIRGGMSAGRDQEISLLGISAQDEFRREQVLNFLEFWRVLIPASLGLLFVVFVLAETFLVQLNDNLDNKIKEISQSDRSTEIKDLEKKVEDFNLSVALIQNVLKESRGRFEVAGKVNDLMRSREIVLLRFWDQGSSLPITVNGIAKTEGAIKDFAAELGKSNEFQNVNLPLSEIRQTTEGVQFSLTFNFVPSTAE